MLSRMVGRAPIGVAATGLALFGIARYRRDLRRDNERLAKFEPSVIRTPFGRVEYAQAGDGPPVMVVHGVLGGFDFGVGVGRVNVPAGYRIISPSRFGFFGSPLPPDPSPAAQADAFAALLDRHHHHQADADADQRHQGEAHQCRADALPRRKIQHPHRAPSVRPKMPSRINLPPVAGRRQPKIATEPD